MTAAAVESVSAAVLRDGGFQGVRSLIADFVGLEDLLCLSLTNRSFRAQIPNPPKPGVLDIVNSHSRTLWALGLGWSWEIEATSSVYNHDLDSESFGGSVVRSLRASLPEDSRTALCAWIAHGGNLEVLKFARGQNKEWDMWTLIAAACRGHLSVLKWARAQGCPWNGELVLAFAAGGGHKEVVVWASENGAPWSKWACAGAAHCGNVEMLQYLRGQGCPWDDHTCYWAAHGGHLEVLQWARAQGCPWDKWTCAMAAGGGHLEVLQWARAQGCPWDEWTCAMAAEGGRLEVLQWARAQECPWDEYTCKNAVKAGNLAILKWAHEHDAELTGGDLCLSAAASGSLEVLRWLREEQQWPWYRGGFAPRGELGKIMFVRMAAANHGHEHIVEYIQDYVLRKLESGTADQAFVASLHAGLRSVLQQQQQQEEDDEDDEDEEDEEDE